MPQRFDTPINTNDQSLDRVLNAGLPVALVFLNGPAGDGLGTAIRQQAQAHAGEILIAQVQMKDNPETARRYSIHSAPAVVTLKQGQALSQAQGISAPEFGAHVAYLLGKGPKPAPEQPQPQRDGFQRSTASAQRPAGGGASGSATTGPQKVTDATFDSEVLRSSLPVIVDFWAPWCGPCRMTDPILEKLALELGGRVKIAKVNVDENPNLSYRYGIQSIPTMMVVRNGQIVDRWMGALPEPALRSRIATHV